MDCNLEHFKLLHRIQKLPLWIIEYAWAHKMIDVLEAVAADEELSLWPLVDLESLTLEESWRLRVASAQAYSIVRRRDIGQFEKVVALLEATHRLVPGLVSPIKHMKIMFGLKTMIVMWMLKNDKGIVDTVVKILQYFPSKLPQYHDQCSCHDMYLMRKNHQDFKTLAQTLAMDKNKLQNYVTEQMEEQYGESYAHKLEDRLLHYLQELETVLPRQTYIDELLKEERPRTEEERLLLGMITLMITPVSTSLKRLLHCVLTSSSPGRVSQKADQVADKCVSSSKDAQHAGPSEVILVPVERRALVEVKPQEMKTMADVAPHLSEDSPPLLEDEEDEDSVEGRSQQRTTDKDGENVVEEQAMEKATSESSSAASDMDERASDGKERSSAGAREEEGEREMHVEGDDDKENENSERSDDSARENVPSPRFWCKRHRWVKSILHECSDEQPEQLQVQHDFSTSPTTLFKLSSSTSSSQDFTASPPSSCPTVQSHPDSSTSSSHDLTPALPFSCPLAQSHPASLTSTPNETTAQDSNEMPPTDKSVSGLVGQPPTVLQTKDSEMVTLLSPLHPLKYSTASNIDIPAFQPQISLQLSPPHVTTSRQQHVLSCLPEPVASLNSYTLSNKDALTFQNAPSTSTGWPAPTRRPLSRLSRRFQRNHFTTSRHQHALSNPPELVAFPYSYTLTLSNKDSTMSQNASTSTRRSQASSPLNQIASHVDRTQVHMSPQCQSVFLQSKLLQPLVRLTRLSQQECRGVTEGRSLTLEEDGNNEMKTMVDVALHLSEFDSPLLLEDEEDEDSVEVRSQQRTTDEDGENVVEEQATEKAKSESSSAASHMDERASDGKERSSAGAREEDGEREMHVEGDDDKENENSERSDDSARENVPSPRFWCKRHRWVKSILHECSDEQPEQLQVQHDFSTSPTTLFKLSSSTSSSQDFTASPPSSCPVVQSHPDSSTSSSHDLTPALPFSCPLAQSHPASLTSTPNETTAQDSNEMPPTDKSVSGLVGQPPTVLQTKDSEMVTLLSPVHPLKYSTASNIDIPAFQPQINLQLSPPHVTTSRQQHVLSCLPEPVASLNTYTLSNKDALTFQNVSSTSTGWPAPTRRPLSRLSRRFQRNHVTTSRHQHATMSQNASTSTVCLSPPRRPLSRLSRSFQRNGRVVCRSQSSTPLNHIPEQSGTHRQITSLYLTESNISVHSTLASAPNLHLRTLSDEVPSSSTPSSEQAIHSQPVAVPQTCNSALSSPCVPWDLNTRLNTHQAQTLPCPSTISHSISQIAIHVDRTQVQMSPQCQSVFLQSKLLQPLVRLTRLSQQECRGVTEGRSLTLEEDGNNEDEELEVGDGIQDLTDTSFNLNSLYSSDESFDSDNEDSRDSDPDYIPPKKKQRVQDYESYFY